jgi:hypothetical protein
VDRWIAISYKSNLTGQSMPIPFHRNLKSLIALLIPLVLVLGSARLLATDMYLTFEYGKDGFPADAYGLPTGNALTSPDQYTMCAHLLMTCSSQTFDGDGIHLTGNGLHADADVFQSVLRKFSYHLN